MHEKSSYWSDQPLKFHFAASFDIRNITKP